MSEQEFRLWGRLRRLRAEGFHFRRQAPFQNYILDFACFSRALVVEVDGPHHEEPERVARDAFRDKVLLREGFQTLRFSTRTVHEDIDAVMDVICRALDAASPTRPATRATLPIKGREES